MERFERNYRKTLTIFGMALVLLSLVGLFSVYELSSTVPLSEINKRLWSDSVVELVTGIAGIYVARRMREGKLQVILYWEIALWLLIIYSGVLFWLWKTNAEPDVLALSLGAIYFVFLLVMAALARYLKIAGQDQMSND